MGIHYTTGSLIKRSKSILTFPQPINNRLRLSIINKILNEADITSIKVYQKIRAINSDFTFNISLINIHEYI